MYCDKLNRKCIFFKYCNWVKKDEKIQTQFFTEFKKEKVNVEKILFEMWLKDVILYQYIDINKIPLFIKNIKFLKEHIIGIYSVIEIESYSETRLKNWFVNIPVAIDKKTLKSFINYDTSSDYKIRNIWTWKLLGYPDCCIKNAVKNSVTLENLKNYERNKIKSWNCPLIWWNIKLYTHIPCSNNCEKTIDAAEKLLLYLAQKNGKEIIKDFFIINKV